MTADLSKLRRAIDEAIYTLENIKRRAEAGGTSLNANFHCQEIEHIASQAIEKLVTVLSVPEPIRQAA